MKIKLIIIVCYLIISGCTVDVTPKKSRYKDVVYDKIELKYDSLKKDLSRLFNKNLSKENLDSINYNIQRQLQLLEIELIIIRTDDN